MARVLQQLVEPPHACTYVPERTASLEVRLMIDVTPDEFEPMLVRGWRRFGPIYFRPACTACMECVSIRLPVDRFAPNGSQRRAGRNTGKLRWEINPPRVDPARLELFHRWHSFRENARGWPGSTLTYGSYRTEFAFEHPCARELTFYDGSRLVGVGICDQTPNAWSAVYFFYDPDYARLSLGTLNVLTQIEIARSLSIPHVYLGYRVEGCASMNYKQTFRPHELLIGRPAPEQEPQWIPADAWPGTHLAPSDP